MIDAFATLDGKRCMRVVARVPQRGAWNAEVDLETDPAVATRCTLALGQLQLVGTVIESQAGVFAQQRRLRIVGGAGGWNRTLGTKAYHNDAGVKALLVAQDAARAVGETLGQFVPARDRLGADYVRDDRRVAAQLLEDVIGAGVLWWVDAAGATMVGQRPTAPALRGSSYQVLAYDPRACVATLSLDDPSLVQIGTVLSGPALPEPLTVREYEVQADAQGVRILAWCGGDEQSAGRLAQLWRALVERVESTALFGLYRYRVVSTAGDGRVSLQAVRKAAGLPDIEPIPQWPGVAGSHATLTPGAEVLVGFVEGDRAQPVVVSYVGKGGPGWVPTLLELGGPGGLPAARQNDQVTVMIPPMAFTGTITLPSGPAPATGVVSPTLQQALGVITTGSSKVKVAT